MAKISQASAKYIIHAKIDIDGVVDRPDVVGAIFGQIEGLLGADLELRELQRSGRIGRIEVNVDSKGGKTSGTIMIPSSLDKAETAIVGGALEIIERIGPCSAKINVTRIEDERIAKRQQVINRAKQLLKTLTDTELPDSQELSTEVSDSVKMSDIKAYGKDKLACGPDIATSEEIIFVEGRADVVNLLRHGFKNAIAVNGTSAPETARKLSKEKTVTLFTDGDRGGDLIIKELMSVCKLDYITKAPDGKEVEELQKKEIHQALRSRVPSKDWGKRGRAKTSRRESKTSTRKDSRSRSSRSRNDSRDSRGRSPKKSSPTLTADDKKRFSKLQKELEGSKDAYVLDKKGEVLGKVPVKELPGILPNLDNVSAVICDGEVDKDAAAAIDKARVKCVVVNEEAPKMRVATVTAEELQ